MLLKKWFCKTVGHTVKSQCYLLHFDVIVAQNLLSTEHFGPARERNSQWFHNSFFPALSGSRSVMLCFPLVDMVPLVILVENGCLSCAVAKLNRACAALQRPYGNCPLEACCESLLVLLHFCCYWSQSCLFKLGLLDVRRACDVAYTPEHPGCHLIKRQRSNRLGVNPTRRTDGEKADRGRLTVRKG